jgi:hypothetical protein
MPRYRTGRAAATCRCRCSSSLATPSNLKDPIEAYGRYSPLVPELTDHSLVASGIISRSKSRPRASRTMTTGRATSSSTTSTKSIPTVNDSAIRCRRARKCSRCRSSRREPALGVVFLRRFVRHSGGPKRIGRRVILERAPSPSAAVREPLAVLHHEINVVLGTWHRWLTGVRLLFFRVPMDFRHLSAVWERLAVAGHAFLIGVDLCHRTADVAETQDTERPRQIAVLLYKFLNSLFVRVFVHVWVIFLTLEFLIACPLPLSSF